MKRALVLLLVAAGLACVDPWQESDWGFGAIDHMQTPADPPLACGVEIPPDALATERNQCAFGPGATAAETLGITPQIARAIPIRHVIVLMKENRSFDHLFGPLSTEGQPNAEPVPPDFSNDDLQGQPVRPFHLSTTCVDHDPGHQSASVVAEVAGGTMSGFVKNAARTTGTDGHFVMGEYDAEDLPFYYWLANTYALSDHHFAPMQSGTFANRNFFLFGTNAGVVDTAATFPPPDTPSLMQTLMAHGYTWAAYSDGMPFDGTLDWDHDDPGVHPLSDLLKALDDGTLPNVAFVDGVSNVKDDHPTADLQVGEAWLRQIYVHAVKSPQWKRLAMVWTYDEAGSFADHVPPPDACKVAGSPFVKMGPRVPLVMISPWARRHMVSHAVHDHTAITRFIEAIFGLPALTARDANSPALFDLLDFSCGRDLSVPAPPPAGTGGCKR